MPEKDLRQDLELPIPEELKPEVEKIVEAFFAQDPEVESVLEDHYALNQTAFAITGRKAFHKMSPGEVAELEDLDWAILEIGKQKSGGRLPVKNSKKFYETKRG